MYQGDIIDPHHHLWDLSTGWYSWLTTERPKEMVFGDPALLARDYLPPDYRADMAGVDPVKTVHIQASGNRDDPVAETRWLAALNKEYGMAALSAAPNMAVKISDLCAYDHDWTVASFRPIILDTIEWFGVARCMFASDLPVVALHGGADKIYAAFKEIVTAFSADEQRALFHDNAAKFYRLD